MDSFDRELQNLFNESIELPSGYQYAVRNALKNRKKERVNRKSFKMVAAVCGCVIIMTSAVLAKNTYRNFYKVNDGMDKAIENGYIAEPKVEYIQSNGIEAKIENYLMDDFNFSFIMDVKLEENIDVDKIARARISNFIITDEEKRILYCDNQEVFNEYVEANQLDYKFAEYNENYINNGTNWYIKEKDSQTNELKIVYNLNAADKYPKSKSLEFKFSTINLTEKEISENEETVLTGNWQIDLEVPEKFYNRECMVYHVKNCSNDKLTVTEAEVYDTCMKLKFTMQTDKIYDEGDSEEESQGKEDSKWEKKQKELLQSFGGTGDEMTFGISEEESEEFLNRYEDLFSLFGDCDSREPYVEIENGKKYYPAHSSSEDGGYTNGERDGVINYWQTFALTKQEATDNLKVYLQYNPDYSGNWEEICIELER